MKPTESSTSKRNNPLTIYRLQKRLAERSEIAEIKLATLICASKQVLLRLQTGMYVDESLIKQFKTAISLAEEATSGK